MSQVIFAAILCVVTPNHLQDSKIAPSHAAKSNYGVKIEAAVDEYVDELRKLEDQDFLAVKNAKPNDEQLINRLTQEYQTARKELLERRNQAVLKAKREYTRELEALAVEAAESGNGDELARIKQARNQLAKLPSDPASIIRFHFASDPNITTDVNVSWGPEQHGFQVGLRLEGEQTQFQYGDQLKFDLVVRNTTAESKLIQYHDPNIWSIGQKVPANLVLSGTMISAESLPPLKVILEPGVVHQIDRDAERASLPVFLLKQPPTETPKGVQQYSYPYPLKLAEGRYQVHLRAFRINISQGRGAHGVDYATGNVEFEVFPQKKTSRENSGEVRQSKKPDK